MADAIEFESVSRSYGNVVALEGISFSVPEGQICGFLGPNGAGKTTAIRILLDLIRPTSGSARVAGIDCQRNGVRARAEMGYLPGDLRLYEGLSGEHLLALFAGLRGQREIPRFGRELSERLAVDLNQRIGNLSKGNKQKLGLVLALMHRPRVLILDEPTSGLDPLVQDEIERILRELASGGRTVFFSSHVLSEVERLCDRVVIIRRGRVVAAEDVMSIRGRTLHILEVTFASSVPERALQLPGVEEIRRDGSTVHLRVTSNLDSAIKAIAAHPVVDLRTEQPSLEDVFLAYYRDSESAAEEPAGVR
jgi:ABC-2 type transport system ATP-binding protein